MTRFSIIIPVYNTIIGDLRNCLDSLLNQTYVSWEAICVDDGSVASCARELDRYSQMDTRVKVVHKLNEGVSVARNVGLRLAKGDIVGFLDSDDLVSKDWLQSVYDAFEKTQADMVKTAFRRDVDFVPYYPADNSYDIITGSDIFVWSAFKNGMPWMNFYRAKIVKGLNFPPGMRVFEDGVFNLYAILNVRRGANCAYAGYCYRFSETSSFKKQITEGEYARLIHEVGKWLCVTKGLLVANGLYGFLLRRFRGFISKRLFEYFCDRANRAHANGYEILVALKEYRDKNIKLVPGDSLYRFAFSLYVKFGWSLPFRLCLKIIDSVEKVSRSKS